MSTTEKLELLEDKVKRMGMMGQWYQRYDISAAAEESKKIIKVKSVPKIAVLFFII